MYYAVWRIMNKNHFNYGKIGGFITVDGINEDDQVPIFTDTFMEMEQKLEDHILKPFIEIIEID